MSSIQDPTEITIQAKAFDFAIAELVLIHRDRFQPLWTVDSWVKFLIWVSLNCGLSGDRESLETFAKAMGSSLTVRMRKLFFERILEDLQIHILADPADSQVLVMPIQAVTLVTEETTFQALSKVGLIERVAFDRTLWKSHENGLLAIPWNDSESSD
ncbi:protein phosphatase [Prochlorococcus sp. MIT 1300]|uniref:protein phosphatase n=1 Tax=Prochlorococcus sp. MIT 1300 TaxID=3096218 RepID=UPI002A756DFE|nr:protein phosphatase [Prochlorococcus sp. MIT 1300]